MKAISIIMLLSLALSSCSVYEPKIVEYSPVKYEYRCVKGVCKDVNANYKYKYVVKEKYKYLSKEELKNKEKKMIG